MLKKLLGISLVAACFIASPAGASHAPSDSSSIFDTRGAIRADVAKPRPSVDLIGRSDLYFLGVSAGVVTLAMFNDQWLTDRAIENQDNLARGNVADVFNVLPMVAVGSAAVLYAYGRWGDHPVLARRAGRAGISTLTAAGVTVGLKAAFGRVRPRDEPDDPFQFKPFSGNGAFPSGHTTIAFAAAVALDRETTSGWVPWIAYPAAAMVGWSRVTDLDHWASDVVAGAVVGGWVSWKMESLLAGRSIGIADEPRTSFLLFPRDGTMQLIVTRQF